jgi:hypothetical protein
MQLKTTHNPTKSPTAQLYLQRRVMQLIQLLFGIKDGDAGKIQGQGTNVGPKRAVLVVRTAPG